MTEFTPEWIAKARNACIFFGEPATTEFRKALDHIERLQKRVEELEIYENKNQSAKEVGIYWVQKLREEEARADLHANLNRKIANALGKKINENWSDIPEIVVQLKQRIAELEQERRWIPVSERLPEEDDNYLILAFIDGIGEYYSVAQYIEGFFFDEYDNKTNDVDFWYPLPKPPESEGE